MPLRLHVAADRDTAGSTAEGKNKFQTGIDELESPRCGHPAPNTHGFNINVIIISSGQGDITTLSSTISVFLWFRKPEPEGWKRRHVRGNVC